MKWTSFPLLMACIALVSCSTFKEYNEDGFETLIWEPDQEITFRPVIDDISTTYRLGLGMRHIFGFYQSNIRVSVRIISPSGIHTLKMYDFKVKEDDGDYVGSCAGDTCDLETIVDENITFTETGEHTIILTHSDRRNQIGGVLAVGLVLDKN